MVGAQAVLDLGGADAVAVVLVGNGGEAVGQLGQPVCAIVDIANCFLCLTYWW
jgi:hypothetical protein